MKVLHIISSLETGGAQKLVGDLLPIMNKFPKIEASVAVFHLTNSHIESSLKLNGVNIINLDCIAKSPKAIFKLIHIIKKYDIIHAHLFPINYLVAIANIFTRKPIIFTEHSTHNRRRNYPILRPIEKLIYSAYSKIGCISNATANSLSNWIGEKIALHRIEIIENGIDLKIFQEEPKQTSEKVFGRFGIPLIMVSRFTESKDHPTVLHALKFINRKDVFVVFVGNGERRNEIENLALSLGLKEQVLFLGNRNDIPTLIKASKIGIQSSNWEGFGLTAIEMMAGGIPVIASDVDGLKQIVEGAGITFKKGDDKALASAINKLIEFPAFSENIINQEKHRIERYCISETATKYIHTYTILMNQSLKKYRQ